MTTSHEAPAGLKKNYLVAAGVLLLLPLGAFIIGRLNAPKPMSLTKTRESVDRQALKGSILLDSVPAELASFKPANLENKIEVLGMTTSKKSTIQGGFVEFTFYYRALQDLDEDWQVFGHIDGVSNVYRIHADHYPAGGKYTTDLWEKGEIIADRYSKLIPLDAPTGRYDVWIGFYIGETRLKLVNPKEVSTDGSNRIKVGTFEVGRR